jgi:DNA transformation protein and related proteins
MATARPRPQVMRLTEAAADRIKELMATSERPIAGFASASAMAAVPAWPTPWNMPKREPDRRSGRGQGRAYPDRSQGGAVPARHRDGLQDRQAVLAIRVQQSEPDLGLRLWRIRATDARFRRGRNRALARSTPFIPREAGIQSLFGANSSGSRFRGDERSEYAPWTPISPRPVRRFRPVTVRRMFGGAGIYADGVMFALWSSGGTLYLKVDANNEPISCARVCRLRSTVMKGGKHAVMPYRQMPERLYDDPDELAQWAARAPCCSTARSAVPQSTGSCPRRKLIQAENENRNEAGARRSGHSGGGGRRQ